VKAFYAVLFCLFASPVFAVEPARFMFAETPYWYTDAVPDKIKCARSPVDTNVHDCRVKDIPGQVPVELIRQDGSEHTVEMMATPMSINCRMGVCANRLGHVAGRVKTPAWLKPTDLTVWYATIGFYIAEENGTYYAFKHGTGPDASNFPRPPIYAELQTSSSLSDVKTYDVWCEPDSDTCDFEGKHVPRKELKNYMPVVETEYCDMLFCYATENYEGVVGRAPYGMIGE
jgi:hypothetical protein